MKTKLFFLLTAGFVLGMNSCNSGSIDNGGDKPLESVETAEPAKNAEPVEETLLLAEPTEGTPSDGNRYVDGNLKAKDLYGVWKLVKVTITGDRPDGPLSYDYSVYNIMYEFKPNGILTVSRIEKTGLPENLPYWIEAGDFSYAVSEACEFHDGRNLKTGTNSYWWCRLLSSNELCFDTAPVDGPIFNLVRIGNDTAPVEVDEPILIVDLVDE